MLLIFAQNEPSVSTSDFDLDSMKGVSRYLLLPSLRAASTS